MTPVTGSNTMAFADDFRLAHEYIYMSPSTAKWNKPHYQAAAAAMAWLLRELPGTPLLMRKVLSILQSDGDPVIAREEATNLIRAQHGLSASLLDPRGPPHTSTQNPRGQGVEDELDELDELDESHIVDGMGTNGVMLATTGTGTAAGRTLHAVSARATAAAPAPAAAAAGGDDRGAADEEDGDCVAAAAAVGAAGPAAARAAATAIKNPPRSQIGNPRRSQNEKKKSSASVCSYLWKRMLCRRANCESSHPDLCANDDCRPKRRPDCPKFHGSFKLERDKPKPASEASGGRNKPNQGNGQRGVVPPTRPYSSRNNNSSNHNRANARAPKGGSNRRMPTDPRKALEETRRELRVLKGTLGNIVAGSTRGHAPSSSSSGNNSRTYCDVAKSGHAQQLSSFASVFATALESAMSSAGLRLTPYVC